MATAQSVKQLATLSEQFDALKLHVKQLMHDAPSLAVFLRKLQRRVEKEAAFFQGLQERVAQSQTEGGAELSEEQVQSHLLTPNVSFFNGLVHVVENEVAVYGPESITGIFKTFHLRPSRPEHGLRLKSVEVDVVCRGGRLWVKVKAQEPASIQRDWDKQKFGVSSTLLDQILSVQEVAKEHEVCFSTPTVALYFTKGAPQEVLDELEEEGITLWMSPAVKEEEEEKKEEEKPALPVLNLDELGKVECPKEEVSNDASSFTVHRASVDEVKALASRRGLLWKGVGCVSVDVSSLLTLCSDLTHLKHDMPFGDATVEALRVRQLREPVLDELRRLFHQRHLLVTSAAWDKFIQLLLMLGGPRELARARVLSRSISVVETDSSLGTSERVRQLLRSQGPNEAVLEMGDAFRVCTVTGNAKFARSVKQRCAKEPMNWTPSLEVHGSLPLTQVKREEEQKAVKKQKEDV